MLPIKTRRRKKPTKNPIAPLPVLHYFYFVSRALKYTTTTTTTTTTLRTYIYTFYIMWPCLATSLAAFIKGTPSTYLLSLYIILHIHTLYTTYKHTNIYLQTILSMLG